MVTNIKSISIPEPCHQTWQQMTPNDNGRHCAHCCKTVVDFTRMSNDQVITWLSTKANVCGRFYTGQIEAINSSASYQSKRAWWKALVAGVALALVLQQARGQSKAVVPIAQARLINNHKSGKGMVHAYIPAARENLTSVSIKSAQIKQDLLIRDLPRENETLSYMWQTSPERNVILGGITAGVTIIKPSKKIWYQINSMYWNVYLPIISNNTPSFNE